MHEDEASLLELPILAGLFWAFHLLYQARAHKRRSKAGCRWSEVLLQLLRNGVMEVSSCESKGQGENYFPRPFFG